MKRKYKSALGAIGGLSITLLAFIISVAVVAEDLKDETDNNNINNAYYDYSIMNATQNSSDEIYDYDLFNTYTRLYQKSYSKNQTESSFRFSLFLSNLDFTRLMTR